MLNLYDAEINGKIRKVYLASDIKKFFEDKIYQEDIKRDIETVRFEIKMCQRVFKNDRRKLEDHITRWSKVIRSLIRCCENYPEMQKELFG